jgi:hypothetical protein
MAAVRRQATVTRITLAAVAQRGEHHVIAWGHTGNAPTDCFHHSGTFVTEHGRRREGDGAIEDGDVTVTQARLAYAHLHFAVLRRAHFDVVPHF